MPDRESSLSVTVRFGSVRWMLSTGYPPIVHNHWGCTGLVGGAATDGPSTRGSLSLDAMPVIVVGAVAASVGTARVGPVRVIDSAGAPPDTLM